MGTAGPRSRCPVDSWYLEGGGPLVLWHQPYFHLAFVAWSLILPLRLDNWYSSSDEVMCSDCAFSQVFHVELTILHFWLVWWIQSEEQWFLCSFFFCQWWSFVVKFKSGSIWSILLYCDQSRDDIDEEHLYTNLKYQNGYFYLNCSENIWITTCSRKMEWTVLSV